jgi:hypothetical protein
LKTQGYIMIGLLVVFALFGLYINRSIKKHDEEMAILRKKKKKGRGRYMPEYKRPGK